MFWVQRICAAVVLCATLLFVILATRGGKLRLGEYRGSFSVGSKTELFLDQQDGPTRSVRCKGDRLTRGYAACMESAFGRELLAHSCMRSGDNACADFFAQNAATS